MTPDTEKRLAAMRANLRKIKLGDHPTVADYIADMESCLSIIDDLLAENAKLNSINSMLKHSNNLLKDALE